MARLDAACFRASGDYQVTRTAPAASDGQS